MSYIEYFLWGRWGVGYHLEFQKQQGRMVTGSRGPPPGMSPALNCVHRPYSLHVPPDAAIYYNITLPNLEIWTELVAADSVVRGQDTRVNFDHVVFHLPHVRLCA
jgi:hypothetical protein